MLKAKDFRKSAWGKLQGNWGNAIVAFLLMDVLIGVSGVVFVGPLLLTGALTVGFYTITLNIVRERQSAVSTLFEGFNDFVRAFILCLTNTLLTLLWSLLFVIPGIIKTYSYSMSYYILKDHPELSANEARKKSMAMMKGNKWRLFCLDFSFIGWFLLCIITFGILLLFVSPYRQVAHAEFYESIRGESVKEAPAFEEKSEESEEERKELPDKTE